MKHTPAPWRFLPNGALVAGDNGLHLGTFSESCGLGDAAEPNKALIAAAPTILHLLVEAQRLGLAFDIGSAYIRRSYVDKQDELNKQINDIVKQLS